MKDDLIKIVEAGILAPSGDNCQPWKFRLCGNNQIDVFNIPERDTSLYSWEQRPSLIAIGAVIENMTIAAEHYGYSAKAEYFPNEEKNLIASIEFSKNSNASDSLFQAIFHRSTNRKPYKEKSLTEEEKGVLREAAHDRLPHGLHLIDYGPSKRRFGRAVALNEKILFENEFLHRFFYEHINWKRREGEKGRLGFYIKELEIPAPIIPIFRLFGKWNLLKRIQRLRIGDLLAKSNARIYSSAGAVGCIAIDANTPESFITAGRVFERVWLAATSLNLSLQPLTGILFLRHRVHAGCDDLSDLHQKIVRYAYSEIEQVFDLDGKNKTIAMAFRIGHGSRPTARSLRLPANIYA